MSQFDDSILATRPPYIRFERRSFERRKTAEEGGGSYYVDQDLALVTSHGSRDVTEKIVDEWFPRLAEEARIGRFNPAWLTAYKEAYTAWKNDQEPPLNGTPIKSWPVTSPSEVKQLLNAHCLTIEDLATANEELLGRIGMGSRALKQKAQDWMTGKNGQAPLVAQLDAMRQVMATQEKRIAELTEKAGRLEAQAVSRPEQAYARPPIEDRLAEAQALAEQGSRGENRELDLTIDELLE